MITDESNDVEMSVIVAEAADKIRECKTHYDAPYERMSDHIEFAHGKQYEEESDTNNRYVINHVRKFINKILAPLTLNPLGGNIDNAGADYEQLLRFIIKDIETESRASECIENAFESAITAGRGFVTVDTDYADNSSDMQKITIGMVEDIRLCWIDPRSKRPDGSDARFAVRYYLIDPKTAKEEHGVVGGSIVSSDLWSGIWSGIDSVPVVIYYKMETTSVHRFFLQDGNTIDDPSDEQKLAIVADPTMVRSYREIKKPSCHVYKIVGDKVVYDTVLPISQVPVVPAYGQRYYDGSRWDYEGIVADLIDPQILANEYKNAEADLIGKAPKAVWLLAKAQAASNPDQWANANTFESDSLLYDHVDVNGVPLPRPERIDNIAQTQSVVGAYQSTVQDLFSISGIFQDAFGQMSGANQSGKSVLERKTASETSNPQYLSNIAKTVEAVTRIVVQLIPHVYVEDRTFDLTNDDGTINQVTVNLSTADIPWEKIKASVSSGPSYEGRRKETTNALMQMFPPGDPQGNIIKDILAEQLDTPVAKQIAKRIKKSLPPEFQDDSTVAEAPDPVAMQALQSAQDTIGTMEQQLEQYKSALMQIQQILLSKDSDNATKLQQTQMQVDAEMAKTILVEQNKKEIAIINAGAKVQTTDQQQSSETMRTLAQIQADSDKHINELVHGAIKDILNPMPTMEGIIPRVHAYAPGPMSSENIDTNSIIEQIQEAQGK